MTLVRTALLVVLLGALRVSAENQASPGPAVTAPSASGSAEVTRARLLPKGSEVPYLGGETPRGTLVIDRTDAHRSWIGMALFLAGWMPALAGSLALVVTSIVLISESIDMVGIGALFAAGLVAVPLIGPLLGILAFSFLTFLPHTLASVVAFGLQTAGVIVMLKARTKTVVYLQDAPEYPAAGSAMRPDLSPAGGPRVAIAF